MALIKCSECEHEISPEAEACPNCGHPSPAIARRKARTRDRRTRSLILLGLLLPLVSYMAFSTRFAEGTMSQEMRANVGLACAAEVLPGIALLAMTDTDVDAKTLASQCIPTWAKAALYMGKTGSVPGASARRMRSLRERAALRPRKAIFATW